MLLPALLPLVFLILIYLFLEVIYVYSFKRVPRCARKETQVLRGAHRLWPGPNKKQVVAPASAAPSM